MKNFNLKHTLNNSNIALKKSLYQVSFFHSSCLWLANNPTNINIGNNIQVGNIVQPVAPVVPVQPTSFDGFTKQELLDELEDIKNEMLNRPVDAPTILDIVRDESSTFNESFGVHHNGSFKDIIPYIKSFAERLFQKKVNLEDTKLSAADKEITIEDEDSNILLEKSLLGLREFFNNCKSKEDILRCAEQYKLAPFFRKVLALEKDLKLLHPGGILENENQLGLLDKIGQITVKELYDNYQEIKDKLKPIIEYLELSPNTLNIGTSFIGYSMVALAGNRIIDRIPMSQSFTAEDIRFASKCKHVSKL